MPITPLPPAPQPTDTQLQFNEKAFDWVAALDTFTTQANALETNVDNLEGSTQVFAGQAANSASAAAASATTSSNNAATALSHASAAAANTNAPLWVSGTTYAAGALVYSAVTGRTYRRITAGAGTTDPSADGTNWLPILLEVNTGLPTIRPSLLLDFANTKRLDPRITFTRTTTARFYDGKTTAKAEENLLLRSQEFNESAWSRLRLSATANTADTTAPDGTSTAAKITTTANNPLMQQAGLSYSGNVVFSVFAKKGNINWIRLTIGSATSLSAVWFDLDNGVVGTQSGTASPTGSIVNVGDGWYRCIVSVTGLSSQTTVIIGVTNADNTTTDYTGDGTESLYLWGAQVEQRSSVTAYTPTTTQPITNYIPALQTAAAGVARFDHNPVTGESLGLLIEEQRANLVVRSQQFETIWANTNTTEETNVVIAPDGTLTADKLIENTSNGGHSIYQGFSVTPISYYFTIYVKAAERTKVALASGVTNANSVVFDLITGEFASAVSASEYSAENVGNGWWRLGRLRNNSDTTTRYWGIALADASGATSYTGDGYSGIYIWGAQLEAGAFPTSYIPTVGSSVTRNADAASMTGANFSSWYRADEGTVYCESFIPTNVDNSVGNYYFALSDGTVSNTILSADVDGTVSQVVTNGTAQFNVTVGSEPTTFAKISLAYKVNDFIACVNSTLSSADTSGTVPVVDRLIIGARGDSTSSTLNNGSIKKLAYYPKRLTNAELQALTTV